MRKDFRFQIPDSKFQIPELVRFLMELVRQLADSKPCPPTGGFKDLSAYWRNLSGS
jgi:hypothetical protein